MRSRIGGGGSGINQLTGDVIAGPGAGSVPTTVSGIQNIPVSTTPPTAGEALVYNGSEYAPGSISSTISQVSVALTNGTNTNVRVPVLAGISSILFHGYTGPIELGGLDRRRLQRPDNTTIFTLRFQASR